MSQRGGQASEMAKPWKDCWFATSRFNHRPVLYDSPHLCTFARGHPFDGKATCNHFAYFFSRIGDYSTANVPPFLLHYSLSVMHSLWMQEENTFLPWLFVELACCPDCFVSGIFINSTHIVSDRITAVFVDRTLWPPNIKCMMLLSNLTPVFHSQALIFQPLANIFHRKKTVSTICKVLIAATLKSLPENL